MTLSGYIFRQLAVGVGVAFFGLVMLILIFDLVELTRRASGRDDVGAAVVIQMALLHLPYLSQRLVPYAVLIGVILTLARLTRTSELVVARASGISVWQFLLPGIVLALVLGTFVVTLFNPLAASMLSRFEQLDARYIRGAVSNLSVSSSGLWLRQADAYGESVIHALRITEPELALHEVTIFRYAGRDRFTERIDADSAVLHSGYWLLHDALITGPEKIAERRETYRVDTSLTISQIEDSFASPETLSFWEIPNFVKLLERAGFSGLKHQVHWHAVLAGPLLLCGMVLLAAAFSLRLTRRGGTGLLIGLGILVGFIVYVFSDVAMALGLAANIPIMLAGWAPAIVSSLIGAALLLHIEDS